MAGKKPAAELATKNVARTRAKPERQPMSINLKLPDIRELRPRITVFGVGGAGGNAVNNMIDAGLQGVEFVVGNTDAQALMLSKCERIIQMGLQVTEGLGAGSQPEVGRAAAEEVMEEIRDHLSGAHMAFITAGMGGGTGTGAAAVVARTAKELGILTVGVVTKPFHFEGHRRMRMAEQGIEELSKHVDTLLVIPNQNLFRIANERTTFADAFAMADQVLYSGVACITDLMVKEGLINLDFADVRAVMREMGKAMMGTGEAQGDKRAISAAEAAIANPLLDDVSMKGARGLLISITGGNDLTLYEVDEAATRIREEVDPEANIILGATFDPKLEGTIRVSVVATGIDNTGMVAPVYTEERLAELAERMKPQTRPVEIETAPAAPPPACPSVRLWTSGTRSPTRSSTKTRRSPTTSRSARCRAALTRAITKNPSSSGSRRKWKTRRPSSRRRRNARPAAPACRVSTNCRSRRRIRSCSATARSRPTIIRRRSAQRFCSALPRSGSAAVRRRRTSTASRPWKRRSRSRITGARRSSRPIVRRRAISIRTGGSSRPLGALRTSWKSQPSCAARRTDHNDVERCCICNTSNGRRFGARNMHFQREAAGHGPRRSLKNVTVRHQA